jgi:hypothetical protein
MEFVSWLSRNLWRAVKRELLVLIDDSIVQRNLVYTLLSLDHNVRVVLL